MSPQAFDFEYFSELAKTLDALRTGVSDNAPSPDSTLAAYRRGLIACLTRRLRGANKIARLLAGERTEPR